VSEKVIARIKKLSDLRYEITHPKSKEHRIYLALDQLLVAPDKIRLSVAEFVVRFGAMVKPYPFFLHGWVFVGMNGNDHWPIVETDNQQFIIALASMRSAHRHTVSLKWMLGSAPA